MPKFTSEQEKLIILLFGRFESPSVVRREFLKDQNIVGRPSQEFKPADFTGILRKFKKNGISARRKTREKPQNQEIIADVQEIFNAMPSTSLRQAARQTSVSKSTIHRVLTQDLQMKPYKALQVQKIDEPKKELRAVFCDWFIAHGENFANNVLFSDEKWFVLDSAPNRQNYRIWSTVPPNVLVECKYQGKKKVMCWVGVLQRKILGPFWFLDENRQPVTVNSGNYLQMLENSLAPALENFHLSRNTWFMQDGAPCHTSDRVIQFLQTKFPDRIISRRGTFPWPPNLRISTP